MQVFTQSQRNSTYKSNKVAHAKLFLSYQLNGAWLANLTYNAPDPDNLQTLHCWCDNTILANHALQGKLQLWRTLHSGKNCRRADVQIGLASGFSDYSTPDKCLVGLSHSSGT